MAARFLSREAGSRTIQPTELVHIVYQRIRSKLSRFMGGTRWFRFAAKRAMRQELAERGRARTRLKRSGKRKRIPFSQVSAEMALAGAEDLFDDLDLLTKGLMRLAELDETGPRMVRVIEMHYFEGFNWKETAERVGVSARQVRRDWRFARTWLHRYLQSDGKTNPDPVAK
jgi:RNA polymerase sigma factor (TIGR02999 family)